MSMHQQTPRDQFVSLLQNEDQHIDLIEAALLIAAEHNPALDAEVCRSRVEKLASQAEQTVDLSQPPPEIGRDLCVFLYQQAGYRGDHQDYYNPENSFFDRVLDRRKGIPISLALIYISVGRLLGLTMEPVGFPGHFLVKIVGDADVLLDPFSGQVLDENDCQELLNTCTQGTIKFKPEHLQSASNRQVVQRMLNNLKAIYMGRKELAEALSVCDKLLLVDNSSAQDLLDRAAILEQLDCPALAADDLEHVLLQSPPADVAEAIRNKAKSLRSRDSGKVH